MKAQPQAIAERLRDALCRPLGMKHGHVAHLWGRAEQMKAGTMPTVGTIGQVAQMLRVSAAWLAFGVPSSEIAYFGLDVRGWGPMPSDVRRAIAAERAERMRMSRRLQGMSPQHLADAAEVSLATIVSYEQGYGGGRLDTLCSVAEALGVCPAWLIFGEGDARIGVLASARYLAA